jgi:hypothetical protein
MAGLEEVEARIRSLLEPYRGELESATIYGMPSLRWPGAKAHDYFVAVRPGKSYVSLYLLVADTYPEALQGTPRGSSSAARARRPSTSRAWTTRWHAIWRRCWPGSTSGIALITREGETRRSLLEWRQTSTDANGWPVSVGACSVPLSGVTADEASNHTYSSNCAATRAWK